MIRTSDETKHISAALLEAQQNMAPVTKDSANPHFRSKYASLSAVMDVAKPALNEAGIALLQAASPIQDNQISVTTRIVHADSCEWIEAEISIPVEQPTAQKVGSALSYGKRYSLTSLLGLAEADDDGQAASHRTERQNGSTRPPAEREPDWQKVSDRMRGEIAACQTVEALYEWNDANARTSGQMPRAAFERINADFLTRKQQLTMPKVDPAAQLDPQAPLDREPGAEG